MPSVDRRAIHPIRKLVQRLESLDALEPRI